MTSNLLYNTKNSHHYASLSFANSYFESVRLHSQNIMASIYLNSGEIVHRTYKDFHSDVLKISSYLMSPDLSSILGVATLIGNTYEHLVWIIAALITKKNLCLLNPTEQIKQIEAKLTCLDNYLLICSKNFNNLHFLNKINVETTSSLINSHTELSSNNFSSEPIEISIFTSGSTGHSKLVAQTDIGIMANVKDLISIHKLDSSVSICTSMPIFHVNALEFSFFATFFSGGKIVLHESFQYQRFLESLKKENVSIISLFPSLAQILLRRPQIFNSSLGSKFRYVVTAASSLKKSTIDNWHTQMNCRLVQGYGLSEAVNFSAIMPPYLDDNTYQLVSLKSNIPSIGQALPCNDIFIVDPTTNSLCAEGEVGEICIRGINIMKGYKNSDNSQVFSGDYLHTGDLGYYNVFDGHPYYFISGRIKDVIKVYGETVSLVEIDNILSENHYSIDAICIGIPDESAGEALVICANYELNLDEKSLLKNFILNNLSGIRRPRYLFFTSSPLRTASGKPKRGELKDAFSSQRLSLENSNQEIIPI